jgi:hypothetical protein
MCDVYAPVGKNQIELNLVSLVKKRLNSLVISTSGFLCGEIHQEIDLFASTFISASC